MVIRYLQFVYVVLLLVVAWLFRDLIVEPCRKIFSLKLKASLSVSGGLTECFA